MTKSKRTKEIASIKFKTDERQTLQDLIKKYKCNPFTGECHVEEVSIHKIGKTYHIVLSEQQMSGFFDDDYIIREDKSVSNGAYSELLMMIKPISEDNNYIFFRRK